MSRRIHNFEELVSLSKWKELEDFAESIVQVVPNVYEVFKMDARIGYGALVGDPEASEELSAFCDSVVTLANLVGDDVDKAMDLVAGFCAVVVAAWYNVLTDTEKQWVETQLGLAVENFALHKLETHMFHKLEDKLMTPLKTKLEILVVRKLNVLVVTLVAGGNALIKHGFTQEGMAAVKKILKGGASRAAKQAAGVMVKDAAEVGVKADVELGPVIGGISIASWILSVPQKSIDCVHDIRDDYPLTLKLLSSVYPKRTSWRDMTFENWLYLFFIVKEPLSKILQYTEDRLSHHDHTFSLVSPVSADLA